MNRRDRLDAVVKHRAPDRVPVSAWGHFYVDELGAETFADRMLAFRAAYDWDFLKVHARASYHVEPFGFEFRPSQHPAQGHTLTRTPIDRPEDWFTLRPAPLDSPAFAEQMRGLALIRRGLPDDVPLIMTVFTPLDMADKLLDRRAEVLAAHVAEAPEAISHALSVFAETLEPFVRQVTRFGVDGVFFSTKWVNGAKLPPAVYRRLATPHDLHMMAPAAALPFNILHVCQTEVFVDGFADYPVSILHWDDHGAHNPSLRMGQTMTGRAVSGGVDSPTLAHGTVDEVTDKATGAIVSMGGKGMILASGCSIITSETPEANLQALRAAPDRAADRLARGDAGQSSATVNERGGGLV